jgi:hypothetical protein
MSSLQAYWESECEMLLKERETSAKANFVRDLAQYRQEVRLEVEGERAAFTEQAVTIARLEWDREMLKVRLEHANELRELMAPGPPVDAKAATV